jgi:predicted GNAT superfamily acetyltransferase
VAEIEACVRLQQQVWGFPDREVIPVTELASVARRGYLRVAEVAGAGIVGFCFGFWTLEAGRLALYSRMVAVLPEQRGHGLGVALKLDQREWVLAQGADLVLWTCDPLVAGNGRLNFGLLGAEAAEYLEDFYGARANDIQRGLPTDRVVVRWPLARPATVARLRRRTVPPRLAEVVRDVPAWLRAEGRADAPAPVAERPQAPRVRVEVPRAIEALRDRDAERALAWRLAVRGALTAAFAAGYRIVDFAPADDRPCAGAYVLERAAEGR